MNIQFKIHGSLSRSSGPMWWTGGQMDGQTITSWGPFYCKLATDGINTTWDKIYSVFSKFMVKLLKPAVTVYSVYLPSKHQWKDTVDIRASWNGSDLLPASSSHATCTQFIKNGSSREGSVLKYISWQQFAWHASPTGANYLVTQPAVEIQFHLFSRWCFHLCFNGTERLMSASAGSLVTMHHVWRLHTEWNALDTCDFVKKQSCRLNMVTSLFYSFTAQSLKLMTGNHV